MKFSAFRLTNLSLLVVATSQAGVLTGKSIETKFLFPDLATQYGATVVSVPSSGIEIPSFPSNFPISTIDFGDDSILITMTFSGTGASAAFNGWQFSEAGTDFSAFTTLAETISGPFTVASGPGFLRVNFSGTSYFAGQFLLLGLDPVAVPEPSSMYLAGVGLAAAITIARLRRLAC
jgi:hypothetical protein